MKKYALRYTWKIDHDESGYTVKDIDNDNHGLCDAMILISIVRPPDGSYSQLLMSADGETHSELTQKDIFKAWLMLGFSLSDNGALQGWQKQTVDAITGLVREHFSTGRKGKN